VKDGKVLATGYRGETGEGRHAEFCALKSINDNVDNVDLRGCTVYTTLEPCSNRKSANKTACATRHRKTLDMKHVRAPLLRPVPQNHCWRLAARHRRGSRLQNLYFRLVMPPGAHKESGFSVAGGRG
jgi:hypothetical protein